MQSNNQFKSRLIKESEKRLAQIQTSSKKNLKTDVEQDFV